MCACVCEHTHGSQRRTLGIFPVTLYLVPWRQDLSVSLGLVSARLPGQSAPLILLSTCNAPPIPSDEVRLCQSSPAFSVDSGVQTQALVTYSSPLSSLPNPKISLCKLDSVSNLILLFFIIQQDPTLLQIHFSWYVCTLQSPEDEQHHAAVTVPYRPSPTLLCKCLWRLHIAVELPGVRNADC